MYRRPSPAWNAEKMRTPVLIHTTTNEEDVHVLEVEHVIKSLKAAGKTIEHKVYQDAPGRLSVQPARHEVRASPGPSRTGSWRSIRVHRTR